MEFVSCHPSVAFSFEVGIRFKKKNVSGITICICKQMETL